MAESISYIKLGNQEHPIDAVTVNGLSFTSEEKTRWNNKQDALTFDSIPTENSENPVKSGGVYDMIVDNEYVISTALNDLNDRMLDVEEGMSGVLVSETDPVFSASPAASITATNISSWNAKQDALTFDSIPTEDSDNLVKSGPLYTVLTNTELVVATALNDLNTRLSDVYVDMSSALSDVYEEIDRSMTAVLTYRGTVGSNGDVSVLPSSHKVGDVYVVSVAGTYAGKTCEVGDYIICKTSGTSASDGDWNVINGENQVSNSAASLAAPGSSVTIATIDGTNITISTPASWTGVSKNGTLTGVTLNGVSASVSNGVAQLSLVFDSIPTENSDNLVKSGDLYTVITQNEYVAAAALNDLNDRVSAVENISTTHISGITFNGSSASVSNGVASISATIPSYFVINGDHYTYTSSSDYETYVYFGDIVTAVSFNGTNVSLSNGRVSISETDPVFKASPAYTITSAMISSWNNKQNALVFDSIPTQNSDNLVKSGVLYSVITDNELVVSTALNDLNDRVSDLENNTGGITGVMFNGVSASINDGVASISATIPSYFVINGYNYSYTSSSDYEAYVDFGTLVNSISFNGSAVSISNGNANINVSIPAAVTESTVAGWGFTKNSGTLTGVKFNGTNTSVSNGVASINARIPSYIVINGNDYAYTTSSDYEAFFNIGNVVTAVSFNGSNVSLSNGRVSMSETDPIFSASVAASITASDISNWNSKTSNTGTLTGVNFNGTDVSVSNGVASITALPVSWSANQSVEGASTGIRRGNTSIIANLDGEFDPELTIKGNSYSTILDTGTLMFRSNSFVVGQGYNYSTSYTSNGIQYKPNGVNTTYSIELPEASGTIALTSQTLPTVTSAQNGQILQVVNGSWTLVTPVSIYSGNGSPDNTQGTNGDLYIQTS